MVPSSIALFGTTRQFLELFFMGTLSMTPSENALNLIKRFESCSLHAYPDPGSHDGRPITIGWGHTGSSVTHGMQITRGTADMLLTIDLLTPAKALRGLAVNQNQYDALVSLIFNIGVGAFETSTLKKRLVVKDYAGAAEEILKWDHANHVILPGLTKRREAERELFLTSPCAMVGV